MEQHLRIAATREFIMAVAERFVNRHRRPPGIRKVVFDAGPVTSRFAPDDLEQTGTIYDASGRDHRIPVVELWVIEHYRTCEVTVRCYDSRYAGWLADLLDEFRHLRIKQASHTPSTQGHPAKNIATELASLGLVSSEPRGSDAAQAPSSRFDADPAPTAALAHDVNPSLLSSAESSEPTMDNPPADPPFANQQFLPDPAGSSARPRRLLPGPKPLTPEQVEDLIRQWRTWRDSMGVQEFCDRIVHMSKTTFYKYMPESEL